MNNMSSTKNMDGARPNEADKPLIAELAVAAMEELVRTARGGARFWISSTDNTVKCFSEDEYLRNLPGGIRPKDIGLKSEVSRASELVLMNPIKLVEILMDEKQWSTMFSGIVSKAMTIEVLSAAQDGNYDGALQVMTAEFQVPSPLVPTRENYFVRYCKQHGNGTWAVADVSLDSLCPASKSHCRRRQSGCLIQEWPNGYSKVTWIEHVEVDDGAVHDIYKSLVNSGLAFGAKRWVTTLERQCERLASAMANILAGEVITTPEGRKSMLKLAERMMLSFYTGFGVSTAQRWTTLSGSGFDDDVIMLTRRNIDDPGSPPGTILSAATSYWIPVPPKIVFDFLRDVNSRSEWDILSSHELVQEMAQIMNYGHDPGNCVSMLSINSTNSSQSNMFILQESCADSTGSYVIYAPLSFDNLDVILNGGDPDYVALLPAGFAIHPDGPGQNVAEILEVGSGGSLLTIAFQVLVDSPTEKVPPRMMSTVASLIKLTANRIKSAVVRDPNV